MKRLIIATTLAMAAASSVQAQSFVENLGRRAAEGLAARAVSALERGRTHPDEDASSASPEAPTAMQPRASSGSARPTAAVEPPAAEAASGPSPWPNNLANPRLRRPGQLTFDAALQAQKDAFKAFGEVDCRDCEGGVSFDTAAKIFLDLRDFWAFDSALGALEIGQSLTWRGRGSVGRITAVGDVPVGPFPCKQLRWELTKKNATATRDGLVCLGKSNPDADKDRWIEVF